MRDQKWVSVSNKVLSYNNFLTTSDSEISIKREAEVCSTGSLANQKKISSEEHLRTGRQFEEVEVDSKQRSSESPTSTSPLSICRVRPGDRSWNRLSVLLLKQPDFRSALSDLCYELLKVSKEKHLPVSPRRTAAQTGHLFGIVAGGSVDRLLRIALKSQEDSIAVQQALELLPQSQLDTMARSFGPFCDLMVPSRNGSFLATWLVSRSADFRAVCQQFCQARLATLVTNKCAVKVMQALAGVSQSFCSAYNKFFKKHYSRLARQKHAIIVMNLCIPLLHESESLEYLIRDLTSRLGSAQKKQKCEPLRLLSNLLVKCDLADLEELVGACASSIRWLFGDKIGNYSVQALFSEKFRKWHTDIYSRLLSHDLHGLLAEKYNQIALMRSLELPGTACFHRELLIGLMMQQNKTKKLILSSEPSTALLLSLMSAVDDARLPEWLAALAETLEFVRTRECGLGRSSFCRSLLHLVTDQKTGQSLEDRPSG